MQHHRRTRCTFSAFSLLLMTPKRGESNAPPFGAVTHLDDEHDQGGDSAVSKREQRRHSCREHPARRLEKKLRPPPPDASFAWAFPTNKSKCETKRGASNY
jgi:hypothetical protein